MKSLLPEMRAAVEALRFFTRVPLPSARIWDPANLARALTYFPLVGWLVGGAAAGAWWLSSRFWPSSICSGISLLATVLLTGAFHEDGLADVCDGLGSGAPCDRALEIMRDSRIGAFGAIGISLMLLFKWQTVAALPCTLTLWALWSGHALSRGAALGVQWMLPYGGAPGGKTEPLATLSISRFGFAMVTAALPLVFAPSWSLDLAAVLVVGLATGLLAFWFKYRIGGYTGDCLGATQQISEVLFYLVVLAVLG